MRIFKTIRMICCGLVAVILAVIFMMDIFTSCKSPNVSIESLENETYNTIVMETGLSDYADIIREYMNKREYYDQITWEVNNH